MTAIAQTNSATTQTNHPLKGQPFDGMPRWIHRIPGIKDLEKLLYAVFCGAYGDDGNIFFKAKTLAAMLVKSERTIGRTITGLENLGLINAIRTGRGYKIEILEYNYLTESGQKWQGRVAKNGHSLIKNKKKVIKKNNNTPEVPKLPPEKPPEQIPKNDHVVADFKTLLRADLSAQFNFKTYHILKSKNLSDGQIKALIDEINQKPDKKSIGWMIAKVCAIDDISSIPDLDQQKANQQKAVEQKKQREKSEAEKYKQWEKEAASREEVIELNLKRKGLLELYLKRKAEKKEHESKMVEKSFDELKFKFFESINNIPEFVIVFKRKTDKELRACNEFKNYCYRNYSICMS